MIVVMVPRAVAPQYWHRPWSEVLAAAEAGTDGLSVHSPRFTPMLAQPPRPDRYPNNPTQYEQELAAYTRELDQAFLRCGDDVWSTNKTWLFQQNW